jgi:hypothetical protein
MEMITIEHIQTREGAQAFAQEWQQWASEQNMSYGELAECQQWASEQNMSYGELAEWSTALRELAEKFDLVEELTENGII